MSNLSTNSAAGVAWDLRDLYPSTDDPALDADLGKALKRAKAFEKKYRGKIAALKPGQAKKLLKAIEEYESLCEQMDRPAVFAMLLHAGKTDDPKHGALLARTQEQRTEINKHLLFFDLEWVKVGQATAKKIIAHKSLRKYRHWLKQKRVWKPYYLSEPEEKVLDAKALTGRSAFGRLFEEATARLPCSFTHDGQTSALSLQEILAKLYDADRGVRKSAADGI
jgi:oligoendopeptidase F